VLTPETEVPATWPTPHIVSVTPPDGTSFRAADVGTGTGPSITLRVAFKGTLDFGINEQVDVRFGLDGQDVSSLMFHVGTTDVPQSGGAAHYSAELAVGVHQAAVSYCDNAGNAYLYEWTFTVID